MYYENALSDNMTFFARAWPARTTSPTVARASRSFSRGARIFADNAYLPQSMSDAMRLPGNATPGNANTNNQPSVGFAELQHQRT